MPRILKYFLLCFPVMILITACEEKKMSDQITFDTSNYTIAETEMNKIVDKKIYFGHQSVGFNIIEGINDLQKKNTGIKLNIIKSNDQNIFKKPVFAHSTIGQNDNPELKIRDFADHIKNGIGNKADIAFLKLCYTDIYKTTDVEKIFSIYKDTMDQLKKEYPQTKFIHVTVPLTVSKLTVRSIIKKLIGRQDNNVKRNQFNDKLIKEYEGKDPVFDIAKIESTYPNGSNVTFTEGGKSYYSLAPEYSSDGGHLNEIGRIIVAKELLIFLSTIDI